MQGLGANFGKIIKMDAFDFIKETTGGATVIETINSSTEEYFFGGNISPTFRKKSTSLVIEIGRYTFKVPVPGTTIRINTGSGLSTFSGTVAQLKAALIPVFPKANSGNGGSGASSLVPTAVKTSGYTAAAGDFIPVDTTSGNVPITLPNAPPDKTQVAVKHVIQGGTNTVSVLSSGLDVFNKTGGSTSLTLTLLNEGAIYQYEAATKIWYKIADNLSLAQLDLRYNTQTITEIFNYLPADFLTSSSTSVATGLTSGALAAGTYEFKCRLFTGSASGSGLQFTMVTTGTVTGRSIQFHRSNSGTAFVGSNSSTFNAVLTVSNALVSATGFSIIEGVIVVSEGATISLSILSVAGGNIVTLFQFSSIKLTKLA